MLLFCLQFDVSCLQLSLLVYSCMWELFLLTIGIFLLAGGAFLLTAEVFLLTMGRCV